MPLFTKKGTIYYLKRSMIAIPNRKLTIPTATTIISIISDVVNAVSCDCEDEVETVGNELERLDDEVLLLVESLFIFSVMFVCASASVLLG